MELMGTISELNTSTPLVDFGVKPRFKATYTLLEKTRALKALK
jgi:hypothetical protein